MFYPNVDWVDETLRGASYGDNITFSARGGGKFVSYYTMLNFLDNRGILQPTGDNDGYSTQLKYSKLNVRTNLDIAASPTTTVQLNLLGNFSEHNRPGTGVSDILQPYIRFLPLRFPLRRKEVFGEVLRPMAIIRLLIFRVKDMRVLRLVPCLPIYI